MYLEICLIIFGVAILLLVGFCIPVLNQVWRTTKDIALTLEILNRSLPTLLTDLGEITKNVRSMTDTANREIQEIAGTVDSFNLAVKGIAGEVQSLLPRSGRFPVLQTAKDVLAVIKGINAFLGVFFDKPAKRV